MSLQPVSARLRQVLADVFDIPPSDITPELSAGSIPAWDSAGHLRALLAVEVEYGIQFDPEKMGDLTTVALLQAEVEPTGLKTD